MILDSIAALVVIASEAKQSRSLQEGLDCFVANAPRNDDSIKTHHTLEIDPVTDANTSAVLRLAES
jgi:hypothetical protein